MIDQLPEFEKWAERDVSLFTDQEMEAFLDDCRVREETRLVGSALRVIARKNVDPGRYECLKTLMEGIC